MTTTTATPPRDFTGWNQIYPLYLDSTRSLKRGRRIPKEKAVPTPTASQILKACQNLHLSDIVQPEMEKKHPRDQLNPGRIRIKLLNDKGDFHCGGLYSNRKDLYIALAEQIVGIQEKEAQQKEAKKQVIEQKQKQKKKTSHTAPVRTFQGGKKKKKKGRR